MENQPPKLLDQVRDRMRARHLTRRTEETYIAWIRRYIGFTGLRHPREVGAAEISGFLSWLAVRKRVSASTQNQALSALLFLFRSTPWCGRGPRNGYPPCSAEKKSGPSLHSSMERSG